MAGSVKFYWDNATKVCLGAFDEDLAPENATATEAVPASGRQIWDEGAGAWKWAAGDLSLPPLTARQIRLALIGAGLLTAAEAAIANASPADQVEWQYASEYRRDHPLIATMAGALSLTDGQVDAMWQSALTL